MFIRVLYYTYYGKVTPRIFLRIFRGFEDIRRNEINESVSKKITSSK